MIEVAEYQEKLVISTGSSASWWAVVKKVQAEFLQFKLAVVLDGSMTITKMVGERDADNK